MLIGWIPFVADTVPANKIVVVFVLFIEGTLFLLSINKLAFETRFELAVSTVASIISLSVEFIYLMIVMAF